ncbi:hypothetical protein D5R93_05670 [Actinomyces lilanjuaniae]|uniref:Uncharacterized protein n=1 Tax=Actinomyces lilanjuaniae TaxID=2321394 RepID=A0ABM6Z399_9ACTO|nr:hypothetical protein [Actinomyces lilanjuaniae]AYD89660.1 hypothetical protein D5R93_05670 [Actinomyces lilanjuaniae]
MDAEHPVYVWRTDWEAIGVWDGSVWRYVRESAAGVMTGDIDYGLTTGQWSALVPGGGSGIRVRGGMKGGTAFIPPRTSLYEVGGYLLVSASSSDTARVDVGAAVNGATGAGPQHFTSLIVSTTAQVGMPIGSIPLYLQAGDVVQLRARQLLTSGRVRVIRGAFSLKEM